MQGFSRALDGSSSSSVWNSAILFCTRSLRRLRPKIGYSCGDGGITPLQHKAIKRKDNEKTGHVIPQISKIYTTVKSTTYLKFIKKDIVIAKLIKNVMH